MNNSERFEQYQKNANNCWKKRLVYKTESGTHPQWKTSVNNYISKNNISFAGINTANELYNLTKYYAFEYANWVILNGTTAKIEDLQNHFVGCIGEMFAFVFFTEVKCVLIKKKNIYERFDFNNVCIRLDGEEDYGVDLTFTIDHYQKQKEGAGQVKFWNAFNNKKINYTHVGSNVFADAVENDFINYKEDNNIVIFWLGNDKNVSRSFKESPVYKHFIFVDQTVLDNTINMQMKSFWIKFNEFIEYIKTI